MFELPSRKDVSKCVITKETIEKGLKPTLVTSGGADMGEPTSSPKSRPSRALLAARFGRASPAAARRR